MNHARSILAGVLATLLATPVLAAATIENGMTYQGQLVLNGTPVTGWTYLKFRMYDGPDNSTPPGVPIGLPEIHLADVVNGAFTIPLQSFGYFPFNSPQQRWLEISVCADGACTSETILTPRQYLAPVPYAFYSLGPWRSTFDGDQVYFPGDVVIGGAAETDDPLLVLSGNGSSVSVDAIYGDIHVNGGNDGHFGFYNDSGAGGTTAIVGQGQARLLVTNTGNVGIGTSTPASHLDVRGDIRVRNGDLFVPGSVENLRLIRGIIDFAGNAPVGCCFSVSHPSQGVYDITFAEAFTTIPAVTATPACAGAIAQIVNPTTTGVRIIMSEAANFSNEVDCGFHLIVMSSR